MYKYKALVTKVYDGDTITVDIDLGFGIWKKKESIRLEHIDTPEIRGGIIEKYHAIIARDYLRELIFGKMVTIESNGKDKYGRYLCSVFGDTSLNINQEMLRSGHARHYSGGKKEPWVFDE